MISSCDKRVEGNVDVEGYYCYAYDFLNVEFRNALEPENPPTPVPTPNAVADISLDLACYYMRNGQKINCESLQFTQNSFYACLVPVTYVYKVINNSVGTVYLDDLLSVDFVSLVQGGMTVPSGGMKEIEVPSQLNLCEAGGTIVTKRALAFATPMNGGVTDEARDNLRIDVP